MVLAVNNLAPKNQQQKFYASRTCDDMFLKTFLGWLNYRLSGSSFADSHNPEIQLSDNLARKRSLKSDRRI
jgi:hypothetical protein